MFCSKCGQQNPDSGSFCIKCGHSLQGLPTAPQTQVVPASSVIPESMFSSELSPPSQAADPALKPHKKSRAGLFVGIAAGGLVLVAFFLVLFLGVIPMLNKTNNNADTTAAIKTAQETVMPVKWFAIDWSKQTSELQKLDSMSVEDFRNSSQDDQLLYWSFLNHIYFTQYHESDSGRVYSKNESASLDDSAQEIIDQEKTQLLTANSSVNEDHNFDPDQARKLLSGTVNDINEAINVSDDVETVAEKYDNLFSKVPKNQVTSGAISDYKSFTQIGKDRSEVKTYADGSKYVSLLMVSENGVTMYIEYKFVTFTNYDGQEQSIWLSTVTKVQAN